MLVTEPAADIVKIIEEAVWGGISAVMWRDKTGRSFDHKVARQIRDATQWQDVKVLVNGGDVNWSFLNGYHLGERGFLREEWDRLLSRSWDSKLMGRSVHSVEAAVRASREETDYLVAGTIFATQSHPDEPGQGIEFLRDVCEAAAPMPVIAIGGITPERVGECIAAGAAGVAVLSPIMRAADPRAVARAYRIELDKAWSLRSTENR